MRKVNVLVPHCWALGRENVHSEREFLCSRPAVIVLHVCCCLCAHFLYACTCMCGFCVNTRTQSSPTTSVQVWDSPPPPGLTSSPGLFIPYVLCLMRALKPCFYIQPLYPSGDLRWWCFLRVARACSSLSMLSCHRMHCPAIVRAGILSLSVYMSMSWSALSLAGK